MRNIFIFIRQNFTFITFVVLQILALWMLVTYNRHQRVTFMGVASEVTGRVNKQVDKIDDYFHQGEENRRVHRMNDSLLNVLKSNFMFPDSTRQLKVDSMMIDSVRSIRRYYWMPAKVVYNTVNFDKNYIQLDRGAKLGIKDNMAVLNSDGAVVGVVANVSPNFSAVMSLLHVQNSISAALKRTGEIGNIIWDGKDPRFVTMKGIPKSVQIHVGDTVVTSRYSYNFPPDKIIGTIVQGTTDPATGFHLIRVKTAVNFANIQQVFVVDNLLREEQAQLETDTEKKIEQQKTQKR